MAQNLWEQLSLAHSEQNAAAIARVALQLLNERPDRLDETALSLQRQRFLALCQLADPDADAAMVSLQALEAEDVVQRCFQAMGLAQQRYRFSVAIGLAMVPPLAAQEPGRLSTHRQTLLLGKKLALMESDLVTAEQFQQRLTTLMELQEDPDQRSQAAAEPYRDWRLELGACPAALKLVESCRALGDSTAIARLAAGLAEQPQSTALAFSLLLRLRRAGRFDALEQPAVNAVSIPRTLWLLQKHGARTEALEERHRRWCQLHPGWQVHWLDHRPESIAADDALPELVRVCCACVNEPSIRGDLLRLAHLWLHGGVAIDWARQPLRSLQTLVEGGVTLLLTQDAFGSIGSDLWAAPPRHPYVGEALMLACRMVVEGQGYSRWDLSGACLLSGAFARHLQRNLATDGQLPAGLRVLSHPELHRWLGLNVADPAPEAEPPAPAPLPLFNRGLCRQAHSRFDDLLASLDRPPVPVASAGSSAPERKAEPPASLLECLWQAPEPLPALRTFAASLSLDDGAAALYSLAEAAIHSRDPELLRRAEAGLAQQPADDRWASFCRLRCAVAKGADSELLLHHAGALLAQADSLPEHARLEIAAVLVDHGGELPPGWPHLHSLPAVPPPFGERLNQCVQLLQKRQELTDDDRCRASQTYACTSASCRNELHEWSSPAAIAPACLERLVAAIQLSLASGEGFSLLRLGDREGVWLKGRLLDRGETELRDPVTLALVEAMQRASWLGFPDLQQVLQGPEQAIAAAAALPLAGPLPQQLIPGGWLVPQSLLLNGLLERDPFTQINGVIATCLPAGLRGQPIKMLPLPDGPALWAEGSGADADLLQRVLSWIEREVEPGDLFLLEGGVIAPIAAEAIRQRGAIGLDLGSLLRFCAGDFTCGGEFRAHPYLAYRASAAFRPCPQNRQQSNTPKPGVSLDPPSRTESIAADSPRCYVRFCLDRGALVEAWRAAGALDPTTGEQQALEACFTSAAWAAAAPKLLQACPDPRLNPRSAALCLPDLVVQQLVQREFHPLLPPSDASSAPPLVDGRQQREDMRASQLNDLSFDWLPLGSQFHHAVQAVQAAARRPLILDAGTSRGGSAEWLARRWPQALVVALAQRSIDCEALAACAAPIERRLAQASDEPGWAQPVWPEAPLRLPLSALEQLYPAEEYIPVLVHLDGEDPDLDRLFTADGHWLKQFPMVLISGGVSEDPQGRTLPKPYHQVLAAAGFESVRSGSVLVAFQRPRLVELAAADLMREGEVKPGVDLTDLQGEVVVSPAVVAFNGEWQYPAITEQRAFERCLATLPAVEDSVYVGFPWASLIDHLNNGTAKGPALLAALDQLRPHVQHARRRITVCQQIFFLQQRWLLDRLGITDVFWPHATIFDADPSLRIHPFPLYPVQWQAPASPEPERTILFSFIGARSTRLYLSNTRDLILNGLGGFEDALVEGYDGWFYDDLVYGVQISGSISADDPRAQGSGPELRRRRFIDSLQRSIFCLCPSGTGPNTIRLWEALGSGSIPIILSDTFKPPGPRALWDSAVFFLPDNAQGVMAIPRLCRQWASDRALLQGKRVAMAELWDRYGPESFIADIMDLHHQPTDTVVVAA